MKGVYGLTLDPWGGLTIDYDMTVRAKVDPRILAELRGELGMVRMNEQSLTPLGTLEDINAIHVIATVEQWWEAPRPTETLWHEWCTRRFGATAASAVASALQKSRAFITQGVCAGGMPLMDHSGIATYSWQPGSVADAERSASGERHGRPGGTART